MPRVRDYKAEYARRIERGIAQGLTRAQARGHPELGKGFLRESPALKQWVPSLEEGVKLIRGGKSLRSAAESIHVSPERLTRYIAAQGVGQKQSGRWKIGADERPRDIQILSAGKERNIRVSGYETARIIGEYWDSVKSFLYTNNPKHLDPYRGVSVADVKGKLYELETNENELYRMHSSGDTSFENIYKIIV